MIPRWSRRVIIHMVKPRGCTALTGPCNANYGFGVIRTCQSRFIDHDKCTTLMGDVYKGETMHACVRAGLCREFLCTVPSVLQ